MSDGLTARLMWAVREGDEKQVLTLIASEGLSQIADGGYTLLLEAIRGRNDSIARLLISSGAKVNIERKQQHYDLDDTPLHMAIFRRKMDIADMLLSRGADIYAIDDFGTTPIRQAIETGTLEFLELLFNRGVDLNARGPDGLRPLHIAAEEGNEDAVLLLLSYGADIDASSTGNKTALCFAAEETDEEVVKLLLQFQPDVNNERNQQAMYKVVQADVDKSFICQWHDDALSKYQTGTFFRSFKVKARQQHFERKKMIFGELVAYGFTYELELGCDSKFFHGAIELGFIEIVEDLLMYGADANMDYCGESPLLMAIKTNQPDFAELLLSYGADVNAQDGQENKTPIYYAAGSGNAKLFNILLTHGPTISDYPNVVHAAILGKSPEIVEQLLNLGNVDINDCTFEETPALFTSLQRSCPDVTALLLDKGADVNVRCGKNDDTPLHVMSAKRDQSNCEILLKKGAAVDSRNKEGRTPLHNASTAEIVKSLLHFGADINARDLQGWTPLQISVNKKREFVVDALIRYGADVDSQDEKGETALHFALKVFEHSVIGLLLNVGADINICDKENSIPLDIALTGSLKRNPRYISTGDSFRNFLHFYRFHIVRMQAINYFVSEDNVQKMQKAQEFHFITEEELTMFKQSCEKEIAELVAKKIENSNISYYAFLSKNMTSLGNLLRNDNIVKAFQSAEINEEFPIYAQLLKSQFTKAMKRKGLVEQAYDMFGVLCSELPPLPAGCVDGILQYLNNKDLHVLISAGKASVQ